MAAWSGQPLPLPPHYDPVHAQHWEYSPDQSALFAAATRWRQEQDLVPAAQDPLDIHLLIIDAQRDFCFPQGSLYVGGRSGRGAIEDNRRLAEFIYRHLGMLKNITVTMDTHLAFQIFFASFWIDARGEPLAAHTVIQTADIQQGRVKPNPQMSWWLCDGDEAWLREQTIFYCAELERAGKYELYLWPPHCILGSDGHALAGLIHEAHLFHSFARGVQSWVETKGSHPLTENYSVLRPEVLMRHDGQPLAQQNTSFVNRLLAADMVIVAGQASSHCVRSSVDDLLDDITARDPKLAGKVYLLSDCMSAVAIPDGAGGYIADFTPQAEEAQRRFAAAGMHVVASTDPLDRWPDLPVPARPT